MTTTKQEVARVLGLAGDEFYQASASRGVPSPLTLKMAEAVLAQFDVTRKPESGPKYSANPAVEADLRRRIDDE